jgi:hypothetical protein
MSRLMTGCSSKPDERGNHKTTKETMNTTLKEYLARREHKQILSLLGTIDCGPRYDCTRERATAQTKVWVDTCIWLLVFRNRNAHCRPPSLWPRPS